MENNQGRWHAILGDDTKMEIPRMASRAERESIRKFGIYALVRRTKNTKLYRARKTGSGLNIKSIVSPKGEEYCFRPIGDGYEIIYKFRDGAEIR